MIIMNSSRKIILLIASRPIGKSSFHDVDDMYSNRILVPYYVSHFRFMYVLFLKKFLIRHPATFRSNV
jgi:hypothetical protein